MFTHCYLRLLLDFALRRFLPVPSSDGRRSKQATKKPRQRSRRGQQRMHIAASALVSPACARPRRGHSGSAGARRLVGQA